MGLRVWGTSFLFVAATGLAATLIAGCNRGDAAAAMAQPAPEVTAAKVVVRDVPLYIDEIGRTTAREMVTIMPQVSGRVDSVHFEEGRDVKKGDLLFQIDPRPFQAALEQAKAAVAQSQANLQFANSDFERVEALKGTSAVSQTEYDQKKSAVAVGEATVEAGKAAVQTAQLNLEYCQIRAPISGRSGERLVDPGNIVTENQTAMVTIQRIDPIYADFTIPENRLPEVRSYMATGSLKVIVQLPPESTVSLNRPAGSPTTAMTSTGPTTTAPTTNPMVRPATEPMNNSAQRIGELSMMDNTILSNSGTIRLRATIPNADEYFWPGQFVQVRLLLVDQPHAILVPNDAIQIGQVGTFVYVVKHDDEKNMDTAELRPVKLGQRQGEMVVISSGLNPDEQVVATGQMLIVPGGPIQVVTPPPMPAAAPTTAPSAEPSSQPSEAHPSEAHSSEAKS